MSDRRVRRRCRPFPVALVALVLASGGGTESAAADPSAAEAGSDATTAAEGRKGEDGKQTLVLPALTVTGSVYQTESSDSYASDTVSVGDKDARPPREVPQSTTVLTRAYLEDRNARSLDTILRETPGIVVLTNDNGRSSLYSRGFEFDKLYLNGLPAPLSSIYGTQPDMSIVDHVEILKGPSGLFSGAGEPAGTVNMRLKQPTRQARGSLSVTGDTWDGLRTEGDVSGPFNASGSLRGRLVLADDEQQTWVRHNDNTMRQAFGSFQADLDDLTTASLTLSHMQRDIAPFNGLPTDAKGNLLDLDRATTTAANWNDFNNVVSDYIGELERRFAHGGHAKLSARFSDRWVDFLYAYSGSAAASNGNVSSVGWLARKLHEQSLALDANLSQPITLFGQEHNVLVGADYQHVTDTLASGSGRITMTNNIYNWNTNINRPKVTYSSKTETSSDQYGVYGQVRVKPIDWATLIGGGRFTWYETDTQNLITRQKSASNSQQGEFTPYAGAIVDLSNTLSAYASYTAIFQPQSQVDSSGKALDPRQGEQYEAGLKGSFLADRLNASAALFRINDKNRAVADTNGNYSASEEVLAQGAEFETSGEVLPGWKVLTGYTYTLSEYVHGLNPGSTFSSVTPKHMLHVWNTYRFQEGPLRDLTIGGGVKTFSSFSNTSNNVRITAPGYTVFDLMASYDINDVYTATLTVKNLFDEKYYERVGGTTVFNFYGEPRSAMLTVKASF